MITHELVQGSSEWLAHRATHWNASDAPAMLGCSPYETRTQLIHRLATGIAPEVDAATQRRFDEGHRFETLARPIAEKIIGEDLYPVVGSEGKLSASFDGLTMAETINFEHKRLNNELRATLVEGCTGADLSMLYQIQMEQQHMVSGAERTLFMASNWAEDNSLIEELHCWYVPNPELAAKIAAGWKQLEVDLAAYVPAPVTVEAVGRAPETLPALHIEVTGMVTASNLDAFKANALAVFGGINRTLSTDAEFADAEKTVKWCGDVEDRLAAAKQHALSQTESIDALFRTIDDISAEARKVRLELDKLVKARKEQVRTEIVRKGSDAYDAHILTLNQRIGRPLLSSAYRNIPEPDFAGVIKGKKTITSLHDAVDTELARVKIAASALADKVQINLDYLREHAKDHTQLFPDTAQIALKATDDLQALVKSRIAEHQAAEAKKEEAQRERIRAEEQAKAAAKPTPQPVVATQCGQDEFDNWRQGGASAPVANVVPMRHAQPAAATPPTLTLGAIGTRLGFNLSADFLKNLGFEATKVKAACLYHESDFALICARLVAHIQGVQAKQAA